MEKRKKNPTAVTLYARNPEIWERAKIKARSRGMSLSQYVEKVLRDANTRIADGNYSGEFQEIA